MLKVFVAFALAAAASFAALSSYDTLPAAQKQDYLWQKIIANTTSDAFMGSLKTVYEIMHNNSANLWAMLQIQDDWREADHHKLTHGIGAVAKAHFEWKTNNYTGMFQKADNCIVRMANAASPGGWAMNSYGPNLAVKCLRDGVESANMEFIWQLDGYAKTPKGAEHSCSYFEAPLANHMPVRDDISVTLTSTFVKTFQKIDSHSMWLGMSQMASGAQNGNAGDLHDWEFPFAVVLQPAPGLNSVPCSFGEPISQLLNLESSGLGVPGKTLYEVYAAHNPKPANLEHIGSLVLDSAFTSSLFADKQLFFRHTLFNADMMGMEGTIDRNGRNLQLWKDYANDPENYKQEGASLYWPMLPGGAEEIEKLAARPQMLQGDMTIV